LNKTITELDCGLDLNKGRGLFAKRPEVARVCGRLGHVAGCGWPGPWQRYGPGGRGGPLVHRGPGLGLSTRATCHWREGKGCRDGEPGHGEVSRGRGRIARDAVDATRGLGDAGEAGVCGPRSWAG